MAALLEVEHINAGYGFLQVLWDVSLKVEKGEFVCLLGANGAGKTTTLRTIAGFLKPTAGDIRFEGQSIAKTPAYQISQMGISFVSESLNLFTNMSVRENLLLGAYRVLDKKKQLQALDFVYSLFPRLKERERQLAGTMSGGERKMLAIARGMMSMPKLLLVDEPSLGLAPQVVVTVFEALQTLQKEGVTILLVEQNVPSTLRITDRGYVMEQGKIVLEGPSKELMNNEHVRVAYMGI
ncbi:MAG: ABC transporter ATP-binding protein [Anaerolineae bacterium]|nr:ABC transporter ATP-binding protein [Anaerolineae bacterium]